MRFYHLADIHLGAVPDRDRTYSNKRAEEIWDSFRSVLRRAEAERPDCIFISGDLFHRQPLARELKEVDYLFSQIPDTRIFLSAGNHDYCHGKSAYLGFPWSPNVYFIDTEEVSAVFIEKLNLTVYGNSYWCREITEPLYDEVRPEDRKGIHVLMAHGGDAAHIPMNYRKIGGHGFHYVAMGHIHKPGIHKSFHMAYAGSLEPLDISETGSHGYMEGSIVYDEDAQCYHTELSFVPAAMRSYVHLEIELKEGMTAYELEDHIGRFMKAAGEQNLFKIILAGYRDMGLQPNIQRILGLGNVAAVEDLSRPAYDMEALKEKFKGQLIGQYLEGFEGRQLTDREKLVRQIGLEALLKTAGGRA